MEQTLLGKVIVVDTIEKFERLKENFNLKFKNKSSKTLKEVFKTIGTFVFL